MIGNTEILVILIFTLLLFGPQKLPELARFIGKAVAEYKRAVREIEDEVNRELAGLEIKEAKDEINLLREIDRDVATTGKNKEELLKEIKKRTS